MFGNQFFIGHIVTPHKNQAAAQFITRYSLIL